MAKRQMISRVAYHWGLALLACLMSGSITHAQETPPPIPRPNQEITPTYPVIRVVDTCRVSVRIDGEDRHVVLCGVTVPEAEVAREQLRRFLENLLHGEEVSVQYEAASRDDSRDSRSAYLFRAPDGLFVNLEILRQGYARSQVEPACKHLRVMRHYERRAERARKGIWAPRSEAERGARSRVVSSQPVRDAGEVIVYVTKSGKKYHRKDCYHLRKSSRPLTLREAVARGYEPCSHCKPPILHDP